MAEFKSPSSSANVVAAVAAVNGADGGGGPRLGGGFVPPSGLASPSPSTASSKSPASLPHPRGKALRPGSAKEDRVRRYAEERLLYISRRYVKKFGIPEPGDEVVGYKSFGELRRDVEDLVNILWLSGTPSLQIPYLLRIASELVSWLGSFAPSPPSIFSVLRKLDHCFASLLSGYDIDTRETLPGFDNGLRAGLSRTDMVRCRSLVMDTRRVVAEVLTESAVIDDEDEDETETETEETDGHATDGTSMAANGSGGGGDGGMDEDGDDEGLYMDQARVYENTLVKLGEVLGESLEPSQMTVD